MERINISYENFNIELKELFEGGSTTFGNLWELVSTKYKIGKARFAKQYKEAHSEWVELKRAVQEDVIQATTSDRLNSAIMQKDEALSILSEIARGKEEEVGGNIIVPSPSDRRGAVMDMATIQGWKAPTKQEVQVSKGATGIFIED